MTLSVIETYEMWLFSSAPQIRCSENFKKLPDKLQSQRSEAYVKDHFAKIVHGLYESGNICSCFALTVEFSLKFIREHSAQGQFNLTMVILKAFH